MDALVVFESMFGNTEAIARAIAEGLSDHLHVELVEVGVAPTSLDEQVGLLVVGAPTHAFGLSRPSTREDAAKQANGAIVSGGIGLREWLASVGRPSGRVQAAAFDTRIRKPHMPGSAARAAARRLRRLGFHFPIPPQSFYVEGTPGPLTPGEEQRARDWGERLGADVTTFRNMRGAA